MRYISEVHSQIASVVAGMVRAEADGKVDLAELMPHGYHWACTASSSPTPRGPSSPSALVKNSLSMPGLLNHMHMGSCVQPLTKSLE